MESYLLMAQEYFPDVTVDVRLYQPGNERVYCCAWVCRRPVFASGSGWVGGWGYDKYSAAVEKALTAAGFTFAQCFAGSGELGIRGDLLAIGDYIEPALYWRVIRVFP